MASYIANPDYIEYSTAARGVYPGSGLVGGTVGWVRSIIQGLCAGAMTFVGILNTIGADLSILEQLPFEAYIHSTLSSLSFGEIAATPFIGPMEIAIGAALFFTAGRGMARVIGLLGAIAYISAIATGTDLSQFTILAENLLESFEAGWSAFQLLQANSA